MAAKPFKDDLMSNEIAHKIGQRLRMIPVEIPIRINYDAKNWLSGDDAHGNYVVAATEGDVKEQKLVLYFSDPDTAFSFKMRFA